MSRQHAKQTSASTNSVAVTTDAHHPNRRMVQNFLLIWFDADINESKQDCQNTLAQLQSIINDVHVFKSPDECVDFLTEIDDEKAFVIMAGTMAEKIVPLIHEVPQLDAVYIFCSNKSWHKQWTKSWAKVEGVYTDIKPICEALQMAVKQCDQDTIAVSFVSMDQIMSGHNIEHLEPSFMYTQIFKKILLELDHDEKSIKKLVHYWREGYGSNQHSLQVIDEFARDYHPQSSIWWYTREAFTYHMLNGALRTLEANIIITMGFLIRDLHRQIEQLHQQQLDGYHGQVFTIYRGQGLSTIAFEKLLKTKGGLMSFNNFLSTSMNRDVSLVFAESASMKTGMVGILFKMTIDPSTSSIPFAAISEVSYFKTEEEVLFSMHTVFRIGEMKKMGNNDCLYQVNLTLTADDDQQLRKLMIYIEKDVVGPTEWGRLGNLLIKIGQFNTAEELYTTLLEHTSDEIEKAIYYNYLGFLKNNQGEYEIAIRYGEKSLEIYQKTPALRHPDMAQSYNNVGHAYNKMEEYTKALSFYEKGMKIWEMTLPPNHHLLSLSYNNIGGVHYDLQEYSKALLFYEKAMDIDKKVLPPNHPDLAAAYNNIGVVYSRMKQFSKTLVFYEKALEILIKALPSNHPDLASCYNNIGEIYLTMKNYSTALSFNEKTLEIQQKALPSNHPDLAVSYNNAGAIYQNIGEYSRAISFYEKALEIWEKTLPPGHFILATSYNNIGTAYDTMGEYSKAVWFYEKALRIWQRTFPPNHLDLVTFYNNVGWIYSELGQYSKALSFYEKVLETKKNTLPSNHPDLAGSYINMGTAYYNTGEYSKALPLFERALNIWRHSLPPNHSHLKSVRESIEFIKKKM